MNRDEYLLVRTIVIGNVYQLLVPVGESQRRAHDAADIVESLPGSTAEKEVVLLNVFEGFEVSGEGETIDSEELYDEESFPQSVTVVADRLEDAGISVTKRREHGDPAKQILAVATEIDADTIVMSGRKRSPTGKVLFGSVTQSVLLGADRPVTVTMSDD